MTLRTAALTTLVLIPSLVLADAEDDDKLCEVIGESPNISMPPKDRLWFKENCVLQKTAAQNDPQGAASFKRIAFIPCEGEEPPAPC